MRKFIGRATAKTTRKILRLMGKGATTLPGKLALKADPSIIAKEAAGKNIITITGTNGKTTTSHMISDLLNELGYDVINNISGANLASGIATTLICGKDEIKKTDKESKGTVYVLETDEAAFAKIAGDLKPKVSVVTNLFRDQLDRYGELTHTRDLIAGGIDKTEAKLVINSDDSLVASLGKGREDRSLFFGMDKESMRYNNEKYPPRKSLIPASPDAVYCPQCKLRYEYKARSFGHLGDFYCTGCGAKSPENRFSVLYDLKESPSKEGYAFQIKDSATGTVRDQTLKVPGSHNLYNTCAAISAVTVMTEILENNGGASADIFGRACDSTGKISAAFGRMEKFKVKNKDVCILLVKNPVGLDRSLQFVSEAEDAGALYLLLNSNFADGKDVSWIWDVDFESKAEDFPENIYVSGQRYGDMLLRVLYTGRAVTASGEEKEMKDIFDRALSECPDGKCVYVLPNYTSMLALRAMLVREFGIKDFWK